MLIHPQHSTAVIETDHELTEREKRRILADMKSVGVHAVILPVGVTLAHVAVQGLDDEDEG